MVVGVGVSLDEILTSRGAALNEVECWSILCRCIELIQDHFINNSYNSNGQPSLYINTNTTQCCSNGRLIIPPCK